MSAKPVITSFEEVASNIETYVRSLASHPGLVSRISMHPAWYAVHSPSGHWLFGPSKFVGYRDANAEGYLVSYERGDGRETEPALAQFFSRVEDKGLEEELREEFRKFAAKYGKVPSAKWRVSVPRSARVKLPERRQSAAQVSDRIAFTAGVCGGRPHIAGTRVRVSDIVAALAAGEDVKEILADFPYLSEADIYAALDYAAKAVDHRVLRAA